MIVKFFNWRGKYVKWQFKHNSTPQFIQFHQPLQGTKNCLMSRILVYPLNSPNQKRYQMIQIESINVNRFNFSPINIGVYLNLAFIFFCSLYFSWSIIHKKKFKKKLIIYFSCLLCYHSSDSYCTPSIN